MKSDQKNTDQNCDPMTFTYNFPALELFPSVKGKNKTFCFRSSSVTSYVRQQLADPKPRGEQDLVEIVECLNLLHNRDENIFTPEDQKVVYEQTDRGKFIKIACVDKRCPFSLVFNKFEDRFVPFKIPKTPKPLTLDNNLMH